MHGWFWVDEWVGVVVVEGVWGGCVGDGWNCGGGGGGGLEVTLR